MADQRILFNEEMVGAGHPSKADTLNRLALAEHDSEGKHKATNIYSDLITKGPWVDVRAFGAVGDGSTDDTDAIQDALDTGKPVYFSKPSAHYKITGELIAATVGQIIFGDGPLSLLKQYTEETNIFRITANRVKVHGLGLEGTSTGSESSLPTSYGAGVVLYAVEDCEVVGNYFKNCSAPGQTAGAAVWLTGSKNCLVRDNLIDGSFAGVNTDAWVTDSVSRRNIITGNIISNVKYGYSGDFQGAQTANCIGDVVEGNVVYNFTSYGIIVDLATHFAINNNHVTGVKGDANYDANGICAIRGSRYGAIDGNIINNCGDNGIVIDDIDGTPCRSISVTGNSINGCDQDGIQLYTCGQISISGNTITNNGRHGIRSVTGHYPRAIAITGNTVYKNGQYGIYLFDPQSFTIQGNIISRNGQAASNTYDGIYMTKVYLDLESILISGNIFEDANVDGSETQRYAVNIASGSYAASWTIVYANNADTGQVTGAINDPTAGVYKIGNTSETSARILKISGKFHHGSDAAPTTGTWAAGDVVYNTAPTAGGYLGWVCTTAGTPGTWKTFGAISA